MTKTDKTKAAATKTAKAPASSNRPQHREVITLKGAQLLAPDAGNAEWMSRTFGLEPVDYNAIREATEQYLVLGATALRGNLTDTAMQIHLQRIVASYVNSAFNAGKFYTKKADHARDARSKMRNEFRDEDRGGPAGFEDPIQRAREFAAQMGLQAFALLAAADGATDAYAHITGETWKPYTPDNSSSVADKAAAAEQSALGR
jgi:hypothetical protein